MTGALTAARTGARTGLLGRLAGLAALLAVGACASTAPVSDIQPGERPALETDEAGFWMAFDEFEADLKASSLVVRDPALNHYVRGIVCNLAGDYCADIRVYIVRHPAFNASMGPNGTMQVYTGLLLRAENEAQLAYVLGHELGHYIRRHTLTRMRDIRNKTDAASVLGLAGAMVGVPYSGMIASGVAYASISAYSRDQEREADEIGFEMFRRAGYEPSQASRIWGLLIAEAEAGDWPDPPLLFASHPATQERQKTLERLAEDASDGPSSTYEQRYQSAILQFRSQWLRDDLRVRNFSGSEHLYKRLAESGHGRGEALFYLGEVYRLRDDEGDDQKAVEAYGQALAERDAPPQVFRSLAFVEWSLGHREAARQAFERYLEIAPQADDRLMIRLHIEELS
jgi:Zn-dependent protease with chaperone function